MCTETYHGKERGFFVRKLQRNISYFIASRSRNNIVHSDFNKETIRDVKEGHFVVFAVKGSEKKRFIVKLEWLNSPEFLQLLKLAEEEYGFEQTGALMVPCRPQELESILMAGPK